MSDGTVLIVSGALLPWLEKRPVGYHDSDIVYTSMDDGPRSGLQAFDRLLLALCAVASSTVLLGRRRQRVFAVVLAGDGGLVSVTMAGRVTKRIERSDTSPRGAVRGIARRELPIG